MLAILASLVSLACIAVAAHRLSLAVSPTPYDLGMLMGALKAPEGLERLRAGLAGIDCWERDLLDAACSPHAAARGALIEEQVLEADWATEKWGRAPRVGASVATSAGFLCASISLIQALGAGDSPVDAYADGATGPTLTLALDALALGIVGTAFCVAVHLRARAVTRQRRAAVDQLADRLRAMPAPTAVAPGNSG